MSIGDGTPATQLLFFGLTSMLLNSGSLWFYVSQLWVCCALSRLLMSSLYEVLTSFEKFFGMSMELLKASVLVPSYRPLTVGLFRVASVFVSIFWVSINKWCKRALSAVMRCDGSFTSIYLIKSLASSEHLESLCEILEYCSLSWIFSE